MNKAALLLALVLCCFFADAQNPPQVNRTTNTTIPVDFNIFTKNRFKIPVFADTTSAVITPDSLGYIIYTKTPKSLWYRDSVVGGGHKWSAPSGGGGVTVDTTNLSFRIDTLAAKTLVAVHCLEFNYIGNDTVEIYIDTTCIATQYDISVVNYRIDTLSDAREYLTGVWPIVQTKSNDTVYTALDSSFIVATLTDGIKSGGYVSYSGMGLTYDITPVVYVKNGVLYNLDATQITLSTADPTDPRYDVPAVDETPGYLVVEGDPEANPVIPQVNPATELPLTSILVSAGDTIPAIAVTVIYNENVEWTPTTSGTVSFSNTINPFNGVISADMSSQLVTRTVTFTKPSGTLDRTDFTLFKMYLDLKATIVAASNVQVRFYNGTTAVTGAITLTAGYGFSKTDVGYQNITIPLSAVAFSSNTFNRVVITFTGVQGGSYIDWVQLQGSIDPGGAAPDGKGVTFYGKNTTRDSTVLILADGTRYAAKDSIGTGGGSGSVEYVVSGTGVIVDSAARVYTINVDTAGLISSKEWFYDRIDSLVATLQPKLDGTGYVKMSGPTVSYQSNTQLTADVNTFTTTLSGAVPAPTSVLGYVLYDNGVWGPAAAGLTNPMTTTGDIIYSSDGSGTPTRLGIGATGSVLTNTGTGIPSWSVFIPYVRYIAASKSAVAADGGNGGTGLNGGTDPNAYNFFIGANSGYKITSGTLNIGMGQNTLDSITTQGGHLAIGGDALGKLAAQSSTAINVGHIAIGYQALANDAGSVSQTANMAMGRRALFTLNGGSGANTALGLRSQELATIGAENTTVGTTSFAFLTGASDRNTGLGKEVGATQVLGSSNTYLGYRAGYNLSNAAGTSFNLFISANASGLNGNSSYTSTNGNIGIFAGSGSAPYIAATSAANNVAIGSVRSGGTNGPLALLTTGSGNIDIASFFGGTNITTANNCITLGDRTAFASATTSNQLNIGNHFVGNGAGSYNWNGTGTGGGVNYQPTFKTSAMMEFVSTTRGSIVTPLQTSLQRVAIASPATGLADYDTDYRNEMSFNGVSWAPLLANHYIAKTATYNILVTDNVINCTANTFTATLPTAVGFTGKQYTIKNSGSGVITIGANANGIATLGTITGGSGYTNGTYTGVALTGGTGTGAVATIGVTGNVVTSVTLTTQGKNYTVSDVLTGTVTGGSGWSVPVATLISESIDGSSTFSLATQYKYVTVVSNGVGYIVTGNN